MSGDASTDNSFATNPKAVRRETVTFQQVWSEEVNQVDAARKARQVISNRDPKDSLIGLAFSGGGIRSATFALGVLQALAAKGLLRQFDYLSTVSGGGYIGSWLAAYTKRFLQTVPDSSFADVEAALVPESYKPDLLRERSFLHWLRLYSNYLTPHKSLISGDTWAMVGTWLRNTFLNQTILGLFFLGLFTCSNAALLALVQRAGHPLGILLGGAAFLAMAAVFMAINIVNQIPGRRVRQTWFQRVKVTITVMLPFFLASFLLNSGLWRWPELHRSHIWKWALSWASAGAIFYFLIWGVVVLFMALRAWRTGKHPDRMVSIPALLVYSPIAGAMGGILLHYYNALLAALPRSHTVHWTMVVLGTGAVMLILLIAGALHLGLTGRGCRDLVREWWARLGGYLMLVTLGWLLLAGVCTFGPLLVRWSLFRLGNWNIVPAFLWVLHNYLGVAASSSSKTSGDSANKKPNGNGENGAAAGLLKVLKSPRAMDLTAKLAPYVFIAGLLLLIATAVHIGAGIFFDRTDTVALWGTLKGPLPAVQGSVPTGGFSDLAHLYFKVQYHGIPILLFAVGAALLIAAVLLSLRVDINDFSMHHFYRNRLVRCYLGASNPYRRPQPFTGFDPADDIALREFGAGYPGPYLILNASLNITSGEELGYATRRAKSFVFTPLYCGYELSTEGEGEDRFLRTHAYRRSYSPTSMGRTQKTFAKVETDDGISLGTAMAISGAAASPNMGYFTSPATAFFMTLFDVRLGWWMGNSRYLDKWKSPGPRLGMGYLLSELVAQSDQQKSYVYLSDGGHFENLAVYELIRRHCKVIVSSDADCDGQYQFDNLLGLIEKARTDFGAEIVIDFEQLRPTPGSCECPQNFVVGTIYYDPENFNDRGALIYLKTSLPKREEATRSGDEHTGAGDEREVSLPRDVWRYYEKHPSFPHQSTADQWFDELQFESYRALGEYIGMTAAQTISDWITDARQGGTPPPWVDAAGAAI